MTDNDRKPQSDSAHGEADPKKHEVPLDQISSPTLERLLKEVRNEPVDGPYAYSRFHHRHNR